MWIEQPFEKQLAKSLRKQFGVELGNCFYTHYQEARNYLEDEVYPNIPATLPSYSDHTAKHVQDVQKNVNFILESFYNPSKGIEAIKGINLYLLGMMVLYHDVGNIFGRDNHNHQDIIAKVYDDKFGNDSRFLQERRIVTQAAQAHSGKAIDGSKDTLGDLPTVDNIDSYPVKPQEMAAVLRFADELAEGPQRTSQFMQKHHLYDSDSLVHHLYANTINVYIDRPGQRIALTYNFALKDVNEKLTNDQEEDFRELLAYTYHRIQKLDQERKYARHYSIYCADFKRTTVAINITKNGKHILNLEDCILDDKMLPGQVHAVPLDQQFEQYRIENVIQKINHPQ